MLALVLTAALAAAIPQLPDYSLPGPQLAGYSTVTVVRPNGSSFGARFVYPATAAGLNAPFDPSAGPYPAISFGHGFVQPPSAYQGTLEHLASWGYLVIASESQGSIFPSHQGLANDMRSCLDWLELRNADPSSALFARVDTSALGLSGHSMGGGCSMLAAAADPRVRVVANLAAAETNPSAAAAAVNVTCPIALISGSQDTVTPLANHGQLMYAAALSPKLLPVIQGGWHCGFVDNPALGGFGCDSGTLPKPVQLALSRRWLTSVFELYLRGDSSVWSAVWGETMARDPEISTSFEPFARITPFAQRAPAAPGSDAVFDFTLRNSSSTPQSFTLGVDQLMFPHSLSSTQVGPLAPGASVQLQLSVSIPIGQPPLLERFTLWAQRDLDAGTRCYGRRGVRVP